MKSMFAKLLKHREIYKDFVLGLAASAVTMVMLQVILYPVLARNFSADEYGSILTVMGVANMLIVVIGGSLNNTRLLLQPKYEERGLEGDFLPILVALSVIATVFFLAYLIWADNYSIVTMVCLLLLVLAGAFEQYGAVIFRIHIDYLKNLGLCMIIAVGNGVGLAALMLFSHKGVWPIVFLLGEIAGMGYLLSTSIFKEKWCFTALLSQTAKQESVLLTGSISANLLAYLDRLLLYPLLGGEAVSTYTVASFWGKSLAILLVPLSGVLLTYYSKKEYKMTRRTFVSTNVCLLGLCVAFMVICKFFSGWITGWFYPTLIGQAVPYLMIANAAAVVGVASTITQPVILTHAPMYWSLFIQTIYMLAYMGLGLWAGGKYGLWGFAYAALTSATLKLLIIFIVGFFVVKK